MGQTTSRIIQAGERGLLVPTEMLGQVQPHSRYVVETIGEKLLIEPEKAVEQRQRIYEEWKRNWDALTEEITAAWNTDKSAAEIISEMRR